MFCLSIYCTICQSLQQGIYKIKKKIKEYIYFYVYLCHVVVSKCIFVLEALIMHTVETKFPVGNNNLSLSHYLHEFSPRFSFCLQFLLQLTENYSHETIYNAKRKITLCFTCFHLVNINYITSCDELTYLLSLAAKKLESPWYRKMTEYINFVRQVPKTHIYISYSLVLWFKYAILLRLSI